MIKGTVQLHFCLLNKEFGIVRVKTLPFHACASTWGRDDKSYSETNLINKIDLE